MTPARRAAFRAHAFFLRPGQNELGKRHVALEIAERVFDFEVRAAGRELCETDFVFVDVSERNDARKDCGFTAGNIKKHIARQPAGAPRRQIKRRLRQRERVLRGRKTGDDFARQQFPDQHLKKRR
jgi:hypothetical protein